MSYPNEPQLPFFVYGTLRPQEVNYYLLEGLTETEEPAYATGLSLYSLGPYPMAIRAEQADVPHVVGAVITPKAEFYAEVIRRLDWLEEYDPHNPHSPYKRIPYAVNLYTGEPITTWLYLGEKRFLQGWYQPIIDGDWVAYRQKNPVPPFQGLVS